jgi:hypothetical protein
VFFAKHLYQGMQVLTDHTLTDAANPYLSQKLYIKEYLIAAPSVRFLRV